MLKLSDFRRLPYATLRLIAGALARDIDAGAYDKLALLETVFTIIKDK